MVSGSETGPNPQRQAGRWTVYRAGWHQSSHPEGANHLLLYPNCQCQQFGFVLLPLCSQLQFKYGADNASVNIQSASLNQKNEVCVVLEPYPDWRTMDAVDEDEQSESSEDNTGQLKSEVRANRQLPTEVSHSSILWERPVTSYCHHCKHFPARPAAPPQLHPPA